MALQDAAARRDGLMVPAANAAEAAVVEGMDVFPISSLTQAVRRPVGEGGATYPPSVGPAGDRRCDARRSASDPHQSTTDPSSAS
jgi:predicted ATPase with chaperone activity